MRNCPTCGAPKPNDDWDWGKIVELNPNGCTIPEFFNVEKLYRLFISATDLLDACKLLVAIEDLDVDGADTRWKQVRKDIRAAIAKAEGRVE